MLRLCLLWVLWSGELLVGVYITVCRFCLMVDFAFLVLFWCYLVLCWIPFVVGSFGDWWLGDWICVLVLWVGSSNCGWF